MKLATKADIPRLNYILSQDGVFEYLVDDTVPRDCRWNIGTNIYNAGDAIIVMPNNQCALFAKEMEDDNVYEVHVAFTKKCRGRDALQITNEAIIWFLKTYPAARKMVALIPISNKKAIVYAIYAGFQRVGTEDRCFIKDGKMIEIIRLEYIREEK